MRTIRVLTMFAAGALVLGAWSMGMGQGRQGTGTQPPQAPIGAPQQPMPGLNTSPLGDDDTIPDNSSNLAQAMAMQRNTARQKKLEAETNQLLSLATQLKVDVDRSDKNLLSVDVVKRADEIEKLAHSVKEGMKGE